jgi:GDPmannose 4,6-dehydratase
LLGDASKAKKKLGWKSNTAFKELVKIMVDADLAELDEKLSGKVQVRRETI